MCFKLFEYKGIMLFWQLHDFQALLSPTTPCFGKKTITKIIHIKKARESEFIAHPAYKAFAMPTNRG